MRKFLLAAAVLAPAAAFANGYHLPISNPRDLAFGGSGTPAIQNDAAAVLANPAALAGLQGFSVNGSLELITLKSKWSDPTGSVPGDVTTRDKAAWPPAAYIAYGDKLGGFPVAAGAGFTVVGGGLFYWPTNWPGRSQIVTVDRKTFNVDLVAAIQLHPMVKIGAGAFYVNTQEKLQQKIPFGALGDGDVQLGAAGGAFSFQAALEVQPIEGLRIAVDYRHKAHQTLEGDAHFGQIPTTFQDQLRDQKAKHALVWPNIFNAGASYQVTPDLLVNVGYVFVRWIVYRDDLFIGDQGLTVMVEHDYKNGFGFSAGAEYRLPFLPVLTVRGGVERIRSPQRPETIHPAIPDASSTSLCFGLGITPASNLDVNVGYKLALLDTITSSGTEAFPGTYKTTAHFISAGVSYRFDPFRK
jgi:long-chain fatty acid transport protein